MVTKNLEATEVLRCGRTARYTKLATRSVELRSGDQIKGLQLYFCMDSKGGGTTQVYVQTGPSDFAAILEAMVVVDRQVTMAAMAAEMVRQVGRQPDHDANTAATARNAVRRAAQRKLIGAPSENRDTEQFIFQSVRRLIDEIDKHEKP